MGDVACPFSPQWAARMARCLAHRMHRPADPPGPRRAISVFLHSSDRPSPPEAGRRSQARGQPWPFHVHGERVRRPAGEAHLAPAVGAAAAGIGGKCQPMFGYTRGLCNLRCSRKRLAIYWCMPLARAHKFAQTSQCICDIGWFYRPSAPRPRRRMRSWRWRASSRTSSSTASA